MIAITLFPNKVEQDIGFEPMTFSLATKHSTTELILHCLVQPPGIEPGSMALQTTAMTTSAKVALAYPQGLEPRPTVLETVMLPLH